MTYLQRIHIYANIGMSYTIESSQSDYSSDSMQDNLANAYHAKFANIKFPAHQCLLFYSIESPQN